jgi:hypothetical protein
MTAKLDSAVQCQFLGQDVGGIVCFAKENLLFAGHGVLSHGITFVSKENPRHAGKTAG